MSNLMLMLIALAASPALADDPKAFVDEKFQYSVTVPAPWTEAPLSTYTVPGTVRAAWAGPSDASIVAFMQEPGQAFSPRFLLDVSVTAMKDKLSCKIGAEEIRTIDGKKAMWLVGTGPGTGGALTGEGTVSTTTQWVVVPREKDIVILLLTCPAADYETNRPSFEKAVASLKIQGTQTAEQAEAK